jgi:penicillin-binding protein 2
MLAEDNRISLRLLVPPRGLILDRNGVPLALNEQNFRAVLVAERAGDVEHILEQLGQLLPMADGDRKRILRDLQRQRSFAPLTVRENLTWDQVSAVEVNLPDLPGVSIEVGQVRSYPFGEAAAHLLGYVGAVSEAEMTDEDQLLSQPGFRIGKNGLEKRHDLDLRGAAGTSELEVNAVGRVVRELSRTEPTPGHQVVLTIDAKLQDYAQQRISAHESAAAVVLEVETGGILALASYPSFNPNEFSTGISNELWDNLVQNEAAPLSNKVTQAQYPPGSTFKPIVAIAALESGVSPDYRVSCSGEVYFGDHPFHCWVRHGHGPLDMHGALEHSCDIYFYDVSRRCGIDKIAEVARRFGMGTRTELELPGERPGLIPDTAWKKKTYKDIWHPGETLVAAIGQGYVLSTPLQLAQMTARLASGGKAVRPHLTKSVEGVFTERTEWPQIEVDPDHLALVLRGMTSVVNSPSGTAYKARITQPGMEMAGKSGSAQVRRITMAERSTGVKKNDELPWKERDHALFISFAPISKPKYACCVVVEHGGGGGGRGRPDLPRPAVGNAADGSVALGCREPGGSALRADHGAVLMASLR